ncbi:MAG: lysylphosphatidylglycerol synthase transmembrane domain-containing protein [Candidatus Fermentibacteria bacterium]|nr:lysylphosphatidylglycerol synthase transmembrane domain-containing protein [Candidatus Fermentibacteria bacterium]
MQKKHKNAIKLGSGILIAALTVWLTFKNTDWAALKSAFSSARWGYVLLVIPALASSYVFRVYRWVTLLAPMKNVKKTVAAPPLLTGFMLNSILPGRLGEFARSALLSRSTGISFVSSFATVVVARLFDGLALTGLTLAVMTAMWNSLSRAVRGGLVAAGCGYIAVLFILIALRKWHEATARVLVFPLRKLHFDKAAVRIEKLLLDFATGLDVLKDPAEMVKVSALTAGVWLSLCVSVVPVFYALEMPWNWFYPPLILVLAGFGMLIPTPGGAGTVHYAIGVLFPAITGIPESQAKALAILFHATQFIPVIIAGLLVSKGNIKLDDN